MDNETAKHFKIVLAYRMTRAVMMPPPACNIDIVTTIESNPEKKPIEVNDDPFFTAKSIDNGKE